MDNFYGSVEDLYKHDKVYTVGLVKTDNSIRVIATCIKDRHGTDKESPRILYEVPNTPSICYLIERK